MPHEAAGETAALAASGDGWDLRLPDGCVQHALTPPHARDLLYRRIHAIESAEQAPFVSLHAATLRLDGHRLVLVGDRGSGKTTLAAALVFDGFALEGDEAIYLTPAGAIARPRSMRIKQAGLRLLPQLAPYLDRLPYYLDWLDRKIFAFDPRAAGLAWRIDRGPIHHLVLIEPNHGGRSVVSPLAESAAVAALLPHATFGDGGGGRSLGAIAAIARGAHLHRLALGDLPNAIRHLRRIGADAK